jgi:hypothetical protein
MHSAKHDELYFATQYVAGLKDEIKAIVEPQIPLTVDRATLIAKIQQKVVDRNKQKYQRHNPAFKQQQHKPEVKQPNPVGSLWRDRQLRDYRKANNLCFHCGEKFEPGHLEVCAKKNKPQINALVVNDLDREISEDALNEMAIEDLIAEDFCQLSLNAIAGTASTDCIQLKSTVKNKTMLILVDTGSSHSFVSSQFVQLTKLPTSQAPKQKVKLANGQWMETNTIVKELHWYIQGHSFSTDMIVLDMLPYDAILGFDWLKANSPMTCDWQAQTIQFNHKGKQIVLQGLKHTDQPVQNITAKQVYKSTKGNDIWAFVILNSISSDHTPPVTPQLQSDDLQLLLTQYADVFNDPM